MAGDSNYQDLQYKDTSLYSVLENPPAIQQKTPKIPQISKDVEEQKGKLRSWKIATIATILISIVILLLLIIIYVTAGKRQGVNSTDLRTLSGKVCVNGEMPCSYCAQNWIHFSGNCYFFSPDSMNWTDSHASCLRMQADLAVIKNNAEETFVEETAHGPNWIGLSRNSAGDFVFVDGRALTDRGFFKKSNEPNNLGGNENCVEVFPSNYGNLTGWNDIPCQENLRYLCKQPAFKLPA